MAKTIEIFGWCFGCGEEVVEWDGSSVHPLSRSMCTNLGPIWPLLRVHDQTELEAGAPELLAIRARGHVLEWVPGRGPIRLVEPVTGYIPLNVPCPECGHSLKKHASQSRICGCQSGYGTEENPICGCRTILKDLVRWLRISADPDGHQVDLADVRAVVGEAREAGVPVWIERLGQTVNSSDDEGPWPIILDADGEPGLSTTATMDMDDPDEWPPDLRDCRRLPDFTT